MSIKNLTWAGGLILEPAPTPVRFIYWLGVGLIGLGIAARGGEFLVDRLDRLLARIRRF